jgi:hypothetical protein
MIKSHVNRNNKKRRFVAIAVAAVSVILVVSIASIGAAPLSVQQQGREQAPGQSVTSSNIVDGEVNNQDLADNAVTSDKIANGEVTSADIEDGTITSTDIAEGTIPPAGGGGTPDDNSVTSVTIVDGEVKSEDIGDGTVTSADIGDGQVAASDLANGAVTTEKIARNAVRLITHQVAASIEVPPNETGFIQAICPPGTTVTGGGFSKDFRGLDVVTSEAVGQSWGVAAFNQNPSPITLRTEAICAELIP